VNGGDSSSALTPRSGGFLLQHQQPP